MLVRALRHHHTVRADSFSSVNTVLTPEGKSQYTYTDTYFSDY